MRLWQFMGVGIALVGCCGVGRSQGTGTPRVGSVAELEAGPSLSANAKSTSAFAQDDNVVVMLASQTAVPLPFDKLRAQDDKSSGFDGQATVIRQRSFFARLAGFYHDDWFVTAPSGAAPERRGYLSPLSSPPWPFQDWPYSGSETIGEPDGNSYPLQTAISGAKGKIKTYGWVSPDVNGSTAGDGLGARNYPVTDNFFPNRVELGQFVVYVERLPDTVQQKHFDWGFHLTSLFGTDYRFTTSKGIFSSQLLDHNRAYGFDPALVYLDLYFPHVAQGMVVRIGRMATIPGIESQIAPSNYTYSHSLLYTSDSFSETGALATIQLTKRFVLQLGVTASHDAAPWSSDARASGTTCVSYTSKSVNNDFYLCADGINDGKYGYNNAQMYDGTWYHRFNKSWHMSTEVLELFQRDVPSTHGKLTIETGTNGANCRSGQAQCFAPEYALQTLLNKQLGPHDYLSLRGEFLNDKKGQRTGVATRYFESTLSYNRWLGSTVQFRPELRFDHSFDRAGYNNGTMRSLFTAAGDVIFHF